MSWKAVEMQVALPRVQDAGKQQDLMGKQGQYMQDTLEQGQIEQERMKRAHVYEYDKTENLTYTQGQEEHAHNSQQNHQSRVKGHKDIGHPFLGNFVDFSG